MEKFLGSQNIQNDGKSKIIERIEKDSGVQNITKILMDIPNTDFQSLFLEVMKEKSKKVGIKELRKSIEDNPFVIPSEIDQKYFIKFDYLAYGSLPKSYKGIELSPLSPFGINTVVADINQKIIFSTTRNSEVISDPTTALALQCAKERIEKIKTNSQNSERIDVATSQRVTRQNKLKKNTQKQHFRTFTVMSAGRDVGFEKFEKEKMIEQISFVLFLFRKLNQSGEYSIKDIKVIISDVSEKKELIDVIKKYFEEELLQVFPEIVFEFDKERNSKYYESLCFVVTAKTGENEDIFHVAGGGITDWTKKIVGSKKERLMFSSIGSEIICKNFKI